MKSESKSSICIVGTKIIQLSVSFYRFSEITHVGVETRGVFLTAWLGL